MALVALAQLRPRVNADSSLGIWMRWSRHFFALAVPGIVLVLFTASIAASAELPRASEYELKAAFLFNFIKFTDWPADELAKSADRFIIGVVGKDPFGATLDKIIEGETVHNRAIVARRFSRMDEAVTNSHVLFISSSEDTNLPAILKILDQRSVLTVSDIDNFAQRGGIISLKKENNKIVFDINLESAKRVGITMNAQLLKLAKIVRGKS
jgi:YfiR/HmsC-like